MINLLINIYQKDDQVILRLDEITNDQTEVEIHAANFITSIIQAELKKYKAIADEMAKKQLGKQE